MQFDAIFVATAEYCLKGLFSGVYSVHMEKKGERPHYTTASRELLFCYHPLDLGPSLSLLHFSVKTRNREY